MALALAKILTVSMAIDLNGFSLLGVSPGPAQIQNVTNFMLVFLVLNHLLAWYSDLKSFVAWNHPGKVVSNMKVFSNEHEQISKLEYYALQVEEYNKFQKSWNEKTTQTPYRAPEQFTAELIETARSLQRSTSRLDLHAKLYLWGWFLILPLSAAGYAIWL